MCAGLLLAAVAGCQPGEPPKTGGGDSSAATNAGQPESVAAPARPEPVSSPAKNRPLAGKSCAAWSPPISTRRAIRTWERSTSWPKRATRNWPIRRSTSTWPWIRPNKLRVAAYQAMLTCDGQKIHAAAVRMCPNQVLVKNAPAKLSAGILMMDPNFAAAVDDLGGPPPQLFLLLAKDPMDFLLHGAQEPALPGAGQNRRPRLLSRADYSPRWIGRVFDRSGDVCPETHGRAHRRVAEPNGERSADRQAIADSRLYRGVVQSQGRSPRL